jgi:putative two-component system response regulator
LHFKNKILLFDDSDSIRTLVVRFLETPLIQVVGVPDSHNILERVKQERPDLILLDVHLPGPPLLESLALLKTYCERRSVAIILISGDDDPGILRQAFQRGASDFVLKPPDFRQLRSRVQAYLAQAELRKLRRFQRTERAEMFLQMSKLVESKEPDTGKHLERVRAYCRVLGETYLSGSANGNFGRENLERVVVASPLHDIGKSRVPDSILLKSGRLSPQEYEVVKRHTVDGAEILSRMEGEASDPNLLATAADITRSHHENWNGRGYPDGLSGEAIPLSARLVAVCDVYDALRSTRTHRKALDHEAAAGLIRQQKGERFDPTLVSAFCACQGEFARIRQQYVG